VNQFMRILLVSVACLTGMSQVRAGMSDMAYALLGSGHSLYVIMLGAPLQDWKNYSSHGKGLEQFIISASVPMLAILAISGGIHLLTAILCGIEIYKNNKKIAIIRNKIAMIENDIAARENDIAIMAADLAANAPVYTIIDSGNLR